MISEYIVPFPAPREDREMKTVTGRAMALLMFIFVALSNSTADQLTEAAQKLEDQLKGKVLLLRGFYQNGTLNYTAQGEVMGNPKTGAWTFAKMQIQEIKVRNDAFELRGPRVAVVMDYNKGEFVNVLPERKDTIKIAVHAPAATLDSQQLENLIQKIFMVEPKPEVGLFPPYWQDFLTGRVTKGRDKQGRYTFKRDNSDFETKNKDATPLSFSNLIGEPAKPLPKNVAPPKLVLQVAPDYSELARTSRISGTVIVCIEIAKSGNCAILKLLHL
jgi:hypothetical protein